MGYLSEDGTLRELTAGEWELYCSERGVNLIARNLNRAVAAELRRVEKDICKGAPLRGRLQDAFRNLFWGKGSAFSRASKYGACDTEPRNHLLFLLEEWARKRHGVEVSID